MTDSLKRKAVSGFSWKAVEKFVNEIVQFSIGVVLARLLSPSDYGTVGLLAIFFAVAATFQDSGFASALIQKKDRSQIDYSTVFLFNLVMSISIYVLFFFAAPYIAAFYRLPILKNITRISALSFIIGALTTIQSTKLAIDLRFRFLSLTSMIVLIVTGATGITLALMGWGVWALVFQNLIGGIFKCIFIWIGSGWKPSFAFSKQSFKQMFSFGGKLLASRLINTIYHHIYTLVIGRVFTPRMVGFYNRANGYAQIPVNMTLSMAIDVTYPILSKVQDDDDRLINAYKKLLRTPLFVLYPALIGLAVVANPLIEIMIGEKWLPCVPMLQILCVGGLFIPLTHINLNLLYVKGRSDLVLRLELIKKPIAFIILFASIPFGIIWMVAGRVLYSIIGFSINCYYTKRMLNYGFVEQMKVLLPILVNVSIMYFFSSMAMSLSNSSFVKLFLGVVVGFFSYVLLSFLTGDESLKDIKAIIKSKINKDNANG